MHVPGQCSGILSIRLSLIPDLTVVFPRVESGRWGPKTPILTHFGAELCEVNDWGSPEVLICSQHTMGPHTRSKLAWKVFHALDLN